MTTSLGLDDDQVWRGFPELVRLLDRDDAGDLARPLRRHRRELGILARDDLVVALGQDDRPVGQAIDLREARGIELASRHDVPRSGDHEALLALLDQDALLDQLLPRPD